MNYIKQKRKYKYLFYVIEMMDYFYLPISAVLMLYYSQFLSPAQIGVILSMGMICKFALDIPTGALSDMFGRRRTLILVFVLRALGLLTIGFFKSFAAVMLGEFLFGLSYALRSGTFESLVYETIIDNGGTEEEFSQVVSGTNSYGLIALFASATIGGFAYDYREKLPFIFQAVWYFLIAIIIFLYIKEPKSVEESEKIPFTLKGFTTTFVKQNLSGIKEIFSTFEHTKITSFLLIISVGVTFADDYIRMFQLSEYHITGKIGGFILGITWLIAGVIGIYFQKIRDRIPDKWLFSIIILILLLSLILPIFSPLFVSVGFMCARLIGSDFLHNLLSVTMNSYIHHNRSTALSTMSFLTNMPLATLSAIVGIYVEKVGIDSFSFQFGIIFICALVGNFVLFYFFKKFAQKRFDLSKEIEVESVRTTD